MSTILYVTVVTNSGAEHKFYSNEETIHLINNIEGRAFHPCTANGEVINTITMWFGFVESVVVKEVSTMFNNIT